MKNLKSIKWTMSTYSFIIGLVVICIGHPWFGVIIWSTALRTEREYYKEG